MPRRFLPLIVAALSIGVGGCFDCGRCIDHEVVVRVRSATGGPVSDLYVTDMGLTPSSAASRAPKVATVLAIIETSTRG